MANCNICGKPVQAASVHHAECCAIEAKHMAEDFCRDYCRYPLERRGEDEMQKLYCNSCPMIRVFNLGL